MSYLNGIDSKRRIYKNKVLEGYRRVVNTAMDSGDAIFCKFTYADSLARFMAANHTTWDAAPETLREKGRLLCIRMWRSWQRTCFGSMGPRVQIPPSVPAAGSRPAMWAGIGYPHKQ